MGKYEEAASEIGKLVEEKNAAYGSAFDKAGDFLRILWPNGCPPEKYNDMLALVRIFDKCMRIATDPDAFSEEPFKDVVGYGLLGFVRHQKNKSKKEENLDLLKEMIDIAKNK